MVYYTDAHGCLVLNNTPMYIVAIHVNTVMQTKKEKQIITDVVELRLPR